MLWAHRYKKLCTAFRKQFETFLGVLSMCMLMAFLKICSFQSGLTLNVSFLIITVACCLLQEKKKEFFRCKLFGAHHSLV